MKTSYKTECGIRICDLQMRLNKYEMLNYTKDGEILNNSFHGMGKSITNVLKHCNFRLFRYRWIYFVVMNAKVLKISVLNLKESDTQLYGIDIYSYIFLILNLKYNEKTNLINFWHLIKKSF